MSKFVKLSFVLSLILGMSAIAFGQSTVTGAIGGVVTNPNGEVVPNAAVTVRNTETNKEDTATSDDQGRFKVSGLQPGNYAVTINGAGFSPFTQEKVTVEVGRETTLNSALSIGPVSGGTVEITSEAPVINTSQQDFSSNINQTSINELPINGRRWSNFALLTPGTVPDGNFGLISFRGVSGLLNNSTVDGGDNNQAFFSEERGRTRLSYSTSQAAVREFQVNTSNYSAEYGRAAGGVVNTVTKSGTNEIHGQLFYYQRNNKWGARNPLAFQSVIVNGVPDRIGIKPVDVRHQFGGNIGGPIVKNKAFFFFNYDQQKRNFPGLGIFSTPGYLSTVTRSALITRGLTDAQIDSSLGFLNSLTGTVPRRGDQKIFFPKVDWNITQNHTLTGSYNRVRWVSPAGIQTQATNTRGRASFGDDFVKIDALNVRLASTFSATLLNEARFQWARDNEFQNSQPPLAGEPTTGEGGRPPDVFLTGGIEFGKPTFLERAAFPDEKRWQFADTVTLTTGNHTLRWGGDINYVKDLQSNLFQEGGAYSYANINDFIVDWVNFTSGGALRTANRVCATSTRLAGKCYTSNYNQGFGTKAFEFPTSDLAYFIQDDWRVTPRLTLNLGLRWEYERMPTPFLVSSVIQTANMPDDRNNFGPRFGFAYDATGDGKTSVRGGYGIYYGRVINSTILAALINTGNPAGQIQVSLNPASSPATPAGNPAAPIFPNVLASPPPGSSSVVFFAKDFSNPQIHQLDVVVEREISRNTVVSASFLASFGNSLPNFVDTNLTAPNTTRQFEIVGGPFAGQLWNLPYFAGSRPNPAFGALTEIRSNIQSKYQALVVQANRRLTNGLQFQTSWTFSRSFDNGQGSQTNSATNVPFNAFDQLAESSLSSFDRRHKFVASVVYNTHFFSAGSNGAGHAILDGWTIAPIFNWLSGPRYTGTVSGNASALFGTNQAGGLNGSNGSTRFALVPRNFFTQPKIVNADLRISRRFGLTESMKLELLAEGFNIFNRTQVSGVNTSIYTASVTGTAPNQRAILTFNPTFGTVNEAGATLFRERQIQFAARFEF
jgi:outer membrane receptor protein involved in Fe transport